MKLFNLNISKINKFNAGDVVKIVDNAIYYNGKTPVPDWVIKRQWILKDVDKNTDMCILGVDIDCERRLDSAISNKYLKRIKTSNMRYNTYIVQQGDSWQSLAKQCNVTVDLLKSYNNTTDNILYIGQKIFIPPISV